MKLALIVITSLLILSFILIIKIVFGILKLIIKKILKTFKPMQVKGSCPNCGGCGNCVEDNK